MATTATQVGCASDCLPGETLGSDGNCYVDVPDSPGDDGDDPGGNGGDGGDGGADGGDGGADTGDPWDGEWSLGDPIRRLASDGQTQPSQNIEEWTDAVVLDDTHALLAGQGGLLSIDMSDASKVHHVTDIPRAYRLAVDGGMAVVASRNDALWMYDVSNPQQMEQTANLRDLDSGYHEDVAIDGGLVLVGWHENGGVLLNLDLEELGALPATDAFAVGLVGDRAVMSDAEDLTLWDVSDPSNPTELDRQEMSGQGRDIAFDGRHLAVGMGGQGVGVWAVEDDLLVHRDDLSVPGSAFGVALDGDYLWIGAWEVAALAWLGESGPVVLGHEEPASSAMGIGAFDGKAVIADWFDRTVITHDVGYAGPELHTANTVTFNGGEGGLTQVLHVGNYGLFDLELTVDGLPTGFSSDWTSAVLAPGERESLVLTAPGADFGNTGFSLLSNDPDETEVEVSLRVADQGVGVEHDELSLQGYTWPDLSLTTHTLSDQRGKVVVLVYWALY